MQRDNAVGTVNYMAPETFSVNYNTNKIKFGVKVDVWSLGIILYQMIYGNMFIYIYLL